jgi:hypothetical protein
VRTGAVGNARTVICGTGAFAGITHIPTIWKFAIDHSVELRSCAENVFNNPSLNALMNWLRKLSP